MHHKHLLLTFMVVVAALTLWTGVISVSAQGPRPQSPSAAPGSTFTYQGQLKNNGAPVNGPCDIAFRLYDAAISGVQTNIALTQTLPVTNGLFTTELNFGSIGNVFYGPPRWLDMQVRCPAGSGSFTPLIPRQSLTAAPMAQTLVPGAYIVGDTSSIFYPIVTVTNNANTGTGNAIQARSNTPSGSAIWAINDAGNGVTGSSTNGTGVNGNSSSGTGVVGQSVLGTGVYGTAANTNPAVKGLNTGGGPGVLGENTASGIGGIGVWGRANGLSPAVWGANNSTGPGVWGDSGGDGIWGSSHGSDTSGVHGTNTAGGYAATFDGRVSVSGAMTVTGSSLSFGAVTRQMLNLWNQVYGIGVQNFTQYFRSDGGFAWFNKGVHSNTTNDPGAGGTNLMTLSSNGDLNATNGTVKAAAYASCGNSGSSLLRSFNAVNATAVTISNGGSAGTCTIDFGFTIQNTRYVVVTPYTGGVPAVRGAALYDTSGTQARFFTWDSTLAGSNGSIFVLVY